MHLPCLDAPAQAEGERTWDSWNIGRSGETVEAKNGGLEEPCSVPRRRSSLIGFDANSNVRCGLTKARGKGC
jgi:hypothetical protein